MSRCFIIKHNPCIYNNNNNNNNDNNNNNNNINNDTTHVTIGLITYTTQSL